MNEKNEKAKSLIQVAINRYTIVLPKDLADLIIDYAAVDSDILKDIFQAVRDKAVNVDKLAKDILNREKKASSLVKKIVNLKLLDDESKAMLTREIKAIQEEFMRHNNYCEMRDNVNHWFPYQGRRPRSFVIMRVGWKFLMGPASEYLDDYNNLSFFMIHIMGIPMLVMFFTAVILFAISCMISCVLALVEAITIAPVTHLFRWGLLRKYSIFSSKDAADKYDFNDKFTISDAHKVVKLVEENLDVGSSVLDKK